ncbi:hypothetical protein AGMMS50230_01850 [Spirochaetia bacterium]|nr:hypothetical protein AGMMS50230_01850 [Spirochaetia bacterium]
MENRKQKTENRKQKTENRKQKTRRALNKVLFYCGIVTVLALTFGLTGCKNPNDSETTYSFDGTWNKVSGNWFVEKMVANGSTITITISSADSTGTFTVNEGAKTIHVLIPPSMDKDISYKFENAGRIKLTDGPDTGTYQKQ